jgi:hypothetical protein
MRRSKMETNKEYLEGLKKQIESMTPLEQACSAAMLQLAELILALMNERRWDAIQAMREMATSIFEQADELRNEKRHVQ